MASNPASAEQRIASAPGLDQPAEILVDQWGIPHIYAETAHDAFFSQGWNAARDRLWQLDLWRKRGLGQLAESFGPAYVARDRAARLLLYRGDIDAEWSAYGPDAKAWSRAWVDGVNAYVSAVLNGEAPLPTEFRITDTQPGLWSLDDMVRIRAHGLNRNVEAEVVRSRTVAAGGVEADALRRKLDPDHSIRIPEGLDPADVPKDVLDDYFLMTKEMVFEPQTDGGVSARVGDQGSNNWTISPQRTATGRPILANDPHRVLVAPSIRYIVHLDAPSLRVMGAGELHLPGVTIGHNEHIAFGITVFVADQEDLYVYELNPQNPRQYRYGDGWEDMRIVRETIAVRGGAAQEVELAYTRHGPVLKLDAARRRAFALRTVWSTPGTSSYRGALRYQTARDWAAFKEALTHYGAATMNFVYADVQGNIGWIPAGFFPRRHWDGLMPVPGDGRYEWDGFLGPDELPAVFNPARGWIATANEMNLPPGYPMEEKNIGYEWADPARYDRIAEVLDANDRITIPENEALQTDVKSLTALAVVGLLDGLSSTDPQVSQAMDTLRAWDGFETTASAAAAIVNVWMNKHLVPAIARRGTTPEAAAIIEEAVTPSPYAILGWLKRGRLERAVRDEILVASLRNALNELAERLGPDMETWTWGALHHAHFIPAAAAAFANPALRAKMSHGPAPVPGSSQTPGASTYAMTDFRVTNGASIRFVIDVGEWDNSRIINTPGQSGDPESPHYSDLFPLWAKGEYVPMLWSRAAVEAATRQVIRLEPARQTAAAQ
ncbi:MAG TPA: penicillin acylase family protein [Caulobacteraceae bacterium]|nr:penicillin acylase family protein [Caulobacteraceae bacterium]